METRWATVDGVHLEVPVDVTASDLRDHLHKPSDAVLVAVTGDLVSVVHADDRPLSELIAGCADTYYFRRESDLERNELLDSPKLEAALSETDTDSDETTFQRPALDR